ncbi:MAG TPA: 6-bladed beta-propeller [Longimicrobiales bacterium]
MLLIKGLRFDVVLQCCVRPAVLLVLIACDSATKQSNDWAGDVLPANDANTRIIAVDAAALSVMPVEITPEFAIGTGQRGASDELGAVVGIAVGGDGRIFIADAMTWRVRVYDPTGNHSRDIGRRGRGPGEFEGLHGEVDGRGINGIALIGDTLLALDAGHIVALDTTGNYLSQTPAQFIFSTASGIAPADGQIMTVRRRLYGDDHISSSPGSARTLYRFSRYDIARNEEAPIAELVEGTVDFAGRGVLYRRPTPFALLPFAISSRGEIFVAEGDSLHVAVVSASGRVDRAYVANVPRVKVSKQDVDDVANDVAEVFEKYYSMMEWPDIRALIRNGPKTEFRPAIGAIIVSEAGTMLIQRPDISESPYNRFRPDARTVWAMIDSAGRPLGNFLLPTGFQAKVFARCDLYGVAELEDGAQVVMKYVLDGTRRRSTCS